MLRGIVCATFAGAMSITFNSIPLSLNTPGAWVEFDASRAVRGLQAMPHDVLIVAQKTSGGLATVEVPYLVKSADEARALGGQHSQAYQMVAAYKAIDSLTPVYLIVQTDNGAGVAAAGSITVAGTATEAGESPIYIAGRRVSVAVTVGMTAAQWETAALAALALEADLPVSYSANSGTGVDFAAIHKGTQGNDIRLGVALQAGERAPAGFTFTVTQLSAGATDVSYTNVITAMADDQYHTVVCGLNSSTALGLMVTELESRWGPMRAIEGHAFAAGNDSQANLTTTGNGFNSANLTYVGYENSALAPAPWEVAARVAAYSAIGMQADPVRAFTGLNLQCAAAHRGVRFTRAQRDTLLTDGVSTVLASSDGRMLLELLITTYQLNALSIPDKALRDLTVVRGLAFLRFTLRSRILSKFARFKLADDGNDVPGQPMVTPSIIKTEILAWFKDLQALGQVENYDQFAAELIIERDVSDPNRVNCILPPDMVNNFLIFAGQIAFKL